ncbi:MAG: hypothetical protein ACRDCT_10430 [Shewanella sp.]|uniref:hypothetical protein n=1 Tax=Shewanella sp. TaxID=50422 RepID=UPI003F3F4C11
MAIKKTVQLTDDTIKVCNNLTLHTGAGINWARSINGMAEQFTLLIEDATPALTDMEWNAFYSLHNGYMPHPSPKQEADLLFWHISEGWQYDGQVREFLGTEEAALNLIERIKGWSTSQRLAVIYKARAYWRNRPIILDDENDDE